MADRGRRHAKLFGRASEAQMPRGGLKGAQLAKWRKFSHARIIDEFSSASAEFFDFASTAEAGDHALPRNLQQRGDPWTPRKHRPGRQTDFRTPRPRTLPPICAGSCCVLAWMDSTPRAGSG